MNAAPDMLWDPKRSSQRINSTRRVRHDRKLGNFEVVAHNGDIIWDTIISKDKATTKLEDTHQAN